MRWIIDRLVVFAELLYLFYHLTPDDQLSEIAAMQIKLICTRSD